MKNIYILFFFIVSQLNYACHCASFNKVRKEALKENKFMLVHFTNYFAYDEDDLDGNPIMNPIQEDANIKELLQNYKYVCVTPNDNYALYKKYNIQNMPQLLLLDGNGMELYRFVNFEDAAEFANVIQNFMIPEHFLTSELANYNEHKTYATAMRLAQKYLDYSLLIDQHLKKGIFKTAESYLSEAAKLIPKKGDKCKENFQKLGLLQATVFAYQRNFSYLNEKINTLDQSTIYESNQLLYYFLKYITAKALHQDELMQIEKEAFAVDGFETFAKKCDLILDGQSLVQAY